MAANLKVVALISGGKDSLFSISHCVANGHEVVALANLHPPLDGSQDSVTVVQPGQVDEVTIPDCLGGSKNAEEVEDLESYMYQTVGHHIIPLYASALDLPLYRHPIVGTNINATSSYFVPQSSIIVQSQIAKSSSDEVESLIPLLNYVKQCHPQVNAVSTGAILSTYQRTRIESVALRLNLVPLSYLWQYPYLPCPEPSQTSLLEDMHAAGLEARVIKVASGGLDAEHLWLNVTEPRTIARLQKDMSMFSAEGGLQTGAVLGEGGEFETLAVTGPRPIWKKRILVRDEDRKVLVGEGGVVTLMINKASVVPFENEPSSEGFIRTPTLLDPTFVQVSHSLVELNAASRNDSEREETERPSSPSATSISQQLQEILNDFTTELDWHGSRKRHVSSATMILRRMSDFSEANAVYSSFFSAQQNPPARITVAFEHNSLFKRGEDVSVSFQTKKRDPVLQVSCNQGLHVQSHSYWAPANIGPYSQAIRTPSVFKLPDAQSDEAQHEEEKNALDRRVYMAGQIPLVPATMELLPSSAPFSEHVALALQHLWRVGTAMSVFWWLGGVAFIPKSSSKYARTMARMIGATWHLAHFSDDEKQDIIDEDEDIDIADLQLYSSTWKKQNYGQAHWQRQHTVDRGTLPDWQKVATIKQRHADGPMAANALVHESKRIVPAAEQVPNEWPPCFVVEVDELPRSALVEWTSTGLPYDSNIVSDRPGGSVSLLLTKHLIDNPSLEFYSITDTQARTTFCFFPINSHDDWCVLRHLFWKLLPSSTGQSHRHLDSVEAFVSPKVSQSHRGWLLSLPGATIIQCRRVWGFFNYNIENADESSVGDCIAAVKWRISPDILIHD